MSDTTRNMAHSAAHLDETHTSVQLHRLIREVPADTFTLEWLIGHLPNRSFGVILLFLAIITVLPIISIPARFFMLILLAEIIIGFRAPVFPKRWMVRPLPSRHLTHLERHAIPMLEKLETLVRPRWCFILMAARRFAAITAFLLIVVSLIAPIPFANVPPALIGILMALAYIEHDGMLFLAAFALALGLLAAVIVAVIMV